MGASPGSGAQWIFNLTAPYKSLAIGDVVGPGNSFSSSANQSDVYFQANDFHEPFSVIFGMFKPATWLYAYFAFSVDYRFGINVTTVAWSDTANESLIALACTPTPICSSSNWLHRNFRNQPSSRDDQTLESGINLVFIRLCFLLLNNIHKAKPPSNWFRSPSQPSGRKSSIPTFIHLPKTGGTTMLSILHSNAHNQERGFLKYGVPPFIWTLFQDIEQRRESLEFLGGHIGLSDLQAVSELQSQDGQPMDFLPFTIMRNPNERLVSFWAYLQDLHGVRNASITQVLSQMLPDSMYRLLAPAGSNLDNPTATMEAIKNSLRSSFALVGLTERFEETLLLLKRQGILHDISFRKHKVLASERPSFDALPLEVQQEITKQNGLDQQLYDFAKELFEEKLREQDDSFWVELEEFRAEQLKLFEEFGECEDDEKPFGGWLCDSEARQKNLNERQVGACRTKKEVKEPTLEEETSFWVTHFINSAFKPKYW